MSYKNYIILFLAISAVGAYFVVKALTREWPPPKPILNPVPAGQKVNIEVSVWETYQSERFGLSFKYPKEWKLRQFYENTYPELVGPNDKCVIHTAVEPTDPGQTVGQWFDEKLDLGGFHAEIISREFVTAANQRGILVILGKTAEGPPGIIELFLKIPKEDYVFVFGLSRASEEKEILPECKNVFDLMTQTLILKERKMPR